MEIYLYRSLQMQKFLVEECCNLTDAPHSTGSLKVKLKMKFRVQLLKRL